MKIEGRAATAEDIQEFYPHLGCSFKAWVCELDGKVEGIVGIAMLRPIAALFCRFNEALRPYLKHVAVLRLLKKAEEAVRASRLPVWTVAQADEPLAPKIITRLGFARLGNIYGDEIYEFRGVAK